MRDHLDDRPIKLRRDRSNAPASGRPLVLALILSLCAGLLLILDHQGMLGPARGLGQQALAPIAQRLTALRDGVADMLARPGSEAALRDQISLLQRENAELKAELIRREQAQIENVFLRQELAIERDRPWSLLGAEVTVRSPDAGRRVLTIARGRNAGVQVGMAVIGQDPGGPPALVGIVEAVGPQTADVLLITDFGSQISARALHETNAALGIVQGQWQRGSRLRLEQIDRTAPLRPGDPVVTAGLTGALGLPLDLAAVPADIPIGSIDSIALDGQQQSAELRPFVDPDQVRYVWVILNQGA